MLRWLISGCTGTVSDGVGFHVLDREQVLKLPLTEVFGFFSDAANLRRITPPELDFKFEAPPPHPMHAGAEIRYRIRVAGVPVRWTTLIKEWDPPHRFSDLQARGPYAYWLHTHTFSEIAPGRTLMRDRVIYRVPFGAPGELVRRLFVEPQLRRVFDYRERAVGPALGDASPPGLPRADTGPRRPLVIAAAGVAAMLGAAGVLWRRTRARG